MKRKAFKKDIKEIVKTMTFVEALKQGLVDYEDFDEFLHEWHISDSNLESYEYLGMTKEQFFEFAKGHYDVLRRMFPRNE